MSSQESGRGALETVFATSFAGAIVFGSAGLFAVGAEQGVSDNAGNITSRLATDFQISPVHAIAAHEHVEL